MFRFILKRLLIAIFLLLGMSFITFLLMRLTPGNFLDTLRLDPQISKDTLDHYEKLYQLNKPAWVQYLHWLLSLLRGDLGYSFYYNVPVTTLIVGRMGNTFLLSFSSFLLTWMVAIPLGIWVALHRNRWTDRLVQFVSYIFLSLPTFFIAMILLLWASQTAWLPLGGMTSPDFDHYSFWGKMMDLLRHLAIPTIALSLGSIAALQRIMRGNMLEELGKLYVTAARAKGLAEHRVIYIHALRNALNPLITLLGYEFAALLSGAAIMEILTSWPGLGALMLTAVRAKDIYLVMASMMMGGLMFIIGNLIADILLAKADPRIRLGERSL
ncbi:MAG: ABC transporter permease [Candidatus Omnitrophica bacterium]|nr:ABC transporter permease [Candidatus Omnitrophota bacterium]